MLPFKSADYKTRESVVAKIRDFIVLQVPKSQLISLYLAGRFLSEDATSKSDIDMFAIVSDEFDTRTEEVTNGYVKNHPDLTAGRRFGFRAFYISDFEGRTRNRSSILKKGEPAGLYIKLFRHSNYKLLVGKDLDFSIFPIDNIADVDELKLDIGMIRSNIEYFKKNNYGEKDPYPNMYNTAKLVLHVAKLEASLTNRCKYEPNFHKLESVFRDDREHIFHEALSIRKNSQSMSLDEKKRFVRQAAGYLDNIERRFLI